MRGIRTVVGFGMAAALLVVAGEGFEMDTIKVAGGEVKITFIGHGTLMFEGGGAVIHIDPWKGAAAGGVDYAKMPKADIVLVTHEHFDHLDAGAVRAVSKEGTTVICNKASASALPGAVVMANGEKKTVRGIEIEAVAAYNIRHMRAPGQPFHPRGVGNGYVLTIGGKRFYVAGDTENTPEMKALKDIFCAFLPMNLPYTMTPEMVADAARAFRPAILYPYHFGDTDTSKLTELLKGSGIEVRIRNMR